MKEIIERILEKLNTLEKEDFYTEYESNNKKYNYITDFIKTLFGQEGEKLGYESAAHENRFAYKDFEYNEREWMFDFVWYKMSDTNDQVMLSVPLVLESELSNKSFGGLKVDFDKLLVASDSDKVFVTSYDYRNEEELKKKEEYIQKAINNYNSFKADETLYLIIWDENDTGKFYFKEFKKQ
ncbi:hypothetical protein K8354_17950 [Polaribacter litorisediminis]|uniref:hypothetical protein n=1 Tax=Polaribacter litorisediminis TaxID=1908341 RepID=UPI001CC03D00|nr:hypothetical protein [Polaribacter litorisediminis]UAM98135.1 hypothetical protein K8354_17950 [Polaribacter litorisediminis]